MANQGTSTGVQAAIAAVNENFMAAFKRGDAAGMVDFYTENGQLLPTGSDFVTGKVAIQAFWQGAMDMGITKTLRLETVEAEGHGDTAIEIGKYTDSGEAGNVMDRGKYVVIWKQEGGQWKLHRDIWNSSLSAQGD
jgi:uncharacterized protein (TIGR02246 family)